MADLKATGKIIKDIDADLNERYKEKLATIKNKEILEYTAKLVKYIENEVPKVHQKMAMDLTVSGLEEMKTYDDKEFSKYKNSLKRNQFLGKSKDLFPEEAKAAKKVEPANGAKLGREQFEIDVTENLKKAKEPSCAVDARFIFFKNKGADLKAITGILFSNENIKSVLTNNKFDFTKYDF